MLEVNRGERDIMTVKKEKWDGRSRPTNDIYSKRWKEIFGKEDTSLKELDKDEKDYLDSLKEKI
jgi:hypothetical protein